MPTQPQQDIYEAAETINPADTSENQFSSFDINGRNAPFITITTLTLDGSTDMVIQFEYSFDAQNWVKLRLYDDSAEWSQTYSGDISTARHVYVFDGTNNQILRSPGIKGRFTAKLTTFAGSPVLTARQGMTTV